MYMGDQISKLLLIISYDKQGDIDVRLYQVDLCLDRAMPAALRVSIKGSLDIGM